MLSDSLFEIRLKILKEIRHYADHPWDIDYPNSQKKNLILGLHHLNLARMAYDSGKNLDNHEWTEKEKSEAYTLSEKEYDDAVNNSDSD